MSNEIFRGDKIFAAVKQNTTTEWLCFVVMQTHIFTRLKKCVFVTKNHTSIEFMKMKSLGIIREK